MLVILLVRQHLILGNPRKEKHRACVPKRRIQPPRVWLPVFVFFVTGDVRIFFRGRSHGSLNGTHFGVDQPMLKYMVYLRDFPCCFFLNLLNKRSKILDLPEKLRWMSQNLAGGFWIFHLKDGIWTFQWKGKKTWYVRYWGQLFFFLLFTNRVEKNIRNPRLFFVDVRKCQCDFGPTRDISGVCRGASLPMPLEKEGRSSWIVGGFWEEMSWCLYSKTLEVWKFCDRNLLSDNKRFDCSEASDFDVRCWGSSDFKQHHRLPTHIYIYIY